MTKLVLFLALLICVAVVCSASSGGDLKQLLMAAEAQADSSDESSESLDGRLLTLVEYLLEEHKDCKRTYGRGGATYVHWGSTSCSSDSIVIHRGYTAGSYYGYKGSTVDFICLPEKPQYESSTNSQSGVYGYLHGTEYESAWRVGSHPSPQNHDMPCAVCQAKRGRLSHLMLPATTQCPSGWTEEYQGYMMSAHYSHDSPMRAICVDRLPETIPNSGANTGSAAAAYLMGAMCGILPCTPYVNGRALSCVVCTQ